MLEYRATIQRTECALECACAAIVFLARNRDHRINSGGKGNAGRGAKKREGLRRVANEIENNFHARLGATLLETQRTIITIL